MLLEEVLVNALQHILGAYFEGVEKKKLRLEVFSGNLVLHNLHVREDALAAFQLPYRIRWGVVSTVRLKVVWQKLDREPVLVEMDELLVLGSPIQQWDQSEHQSMVRKAKEEEVQAALLIAQQQNDEEKGFLERLVERVLDNLKLSITNVHIRYEDAFTTPERPFAVGLTFSKLTATTTSIQGAGSSTAGSTAGATPPGGPVHKLIELEQLCLYWNSDVGSDGAGHEWFCTDVAEEANMDLVRSRFAAYIAAAATAANAASTATSATAAAAAAAGTFDDPRSRPSGPAQRYLLAPLSASADLIMAKAAGVRAGKPHFEWRVRLPDFCVELHEDQYQVSISNPIPNPNPNPGSMRTSTRCPSLTLSLTLTLTQAP